MEQLKTRDQVAEEIKNLVAQIHEKVHYDTEEFDRDNLINALVFMQRAKDCLIINT